MKTENKCFFSVSLKNGITITGENPQEVQHFVLNLQLACRDSREWTNQETEDEKCRNAWNDVMYSYESEFFNAWHTIHNNMKGDEE